jgi:hypothetical protein
MAPAPHHQLRASGESDLSLLEKAIALLNEARTAIPVVNYALGVVGVGAAGFIIWFFFRDNYNIIFAVFGMFVAMIVLFVFASTSNMPKRFKKYIDFFGIALVGVTTAFFCGCLLLALSALVFERPAGLARYFHKTPQIEQRPGRWIHPGGSSYSEMRLEKKGDILNFYYVTPRQGMLEEGVKRGDLFFDGKIIGSQYVGNARIFKKGCDPILFPVSGTLQASEFIAVEGSTLDFEKEGCNPTSQVSFKRLVFMRIGD